MGYFPFCPTGKKGAPRSVRADTPPGRILTEKETDMPQKKTDKKTVLIADDSELNREMLVGILGKQYHYLFAEDGVQAVEQLGLGVPVDIVLLDINMPKMGGFEVLRIMKERRWIEECPVVIISTEDDVTCIKKAYELGATDYITRPFNALAIIHRVENTLALYAKQKRLVRLVEEQVLERERTNNLMINLFSHAIESRNLESGSHTLHVQTITHLLLRRLIKITDRYPITEADISLISSLSALHDIGKITVPDEIINKPGKLTPEEWEIMKAHTTNGDKILDSISTADQPKKLMEIAHAIVRHHHERWDGRGYPDGLRGDDIPIAAQVVSLADVYDALTSDRCYKKAFPHETAIRMIVSGECGAFNPLLIRCLEEVADELPDCVGQSAGDYNFKNEAISLAGEMLSEESLPLDDRTRRLIEDERIKKRFFAEECGGIQFEYDVKLHKVTYTNYYKSGKMQRQLYINEGDSIELLGKEDWNRLVDALRKTTRQHPNIEMEVLIPVRHTYRWHRLRAITVWPVRGEDYIFALGHFADIHDEVISRGLEKIAADDAFTPESYRLIKNLFGSVRIVDPTTSELLEVAEDGKLEKTRTPCYATWGKDEKCKNCTSAKSLASGNWFSKLEIGEDGKIVSVLSRRVRLNGRECVAELLFPMDEETDISLRDSLPDRPDLILVNFYRDTLTHAYSRAYLEDFLPNLRHADGVALFDLLHLHTVNETYGHDAGDALLRAVADALSSSVGENDTLIRYGGNEFLILFREIKSVAFRDTVNALREKILAVTAEGYPDLRPTVAVGCAYHVFPLAQAISDADREMHKEKEQSAQPAPVKDKE